MLAKRFITPSNFRHRKFKSVMETAVRQSHSRLPGLMEFPHVHQPSMPHCLRNWFISSVLIRPYFDNHFSILQFAKGAKFAAAEVSKNLANGDMENLEGLLTPDCIRAVQNNLCSFSESERSELNIKKEDIYFSFLYQIGIMMDEIDVEGSYNRHVECTWVAHSLPNYLDIAEECNFNPVKIKEEVRRKGGPIILNYRFIRDYTRGVNDTWTVNALNYFKLLH